LENSLHQPDEIESCDHPYRQWLSSTPKRRSQF
jgi:hypothetical protein